MKLSKGFTLIELIVVMAVFLFVIGAAITIFISIVQHQKRVLAEQQLLNQISYVEEYMSKALRMANADNLGSCLGLDNTGYIYLLTRYDLVSQVFKGIKFINQSDNNACQEFFLDSGDASTQLVLKEEKNNNPGTITPLTPDNLQINYIKFSINGSNGSTFTSLSCPTNLQCGASNADTTTQPRVTILLDVKIPGDSQEPDRIIQTTVSQRNLNVQSNAQ